MFGRPRHDAHDIIDMRGTISSVGFASGDRFVVGRWLDSPIGPTVDVMWARADGVRVLLAPDRACAEFVTSVYRFDRVAIVPMTCDASPSHVELTAGDLTLSMAAGGRRWPLPRPRPAWFTRWVEGPVAAPLLGVSTYGVSPTGVEEWYRADALRWVTDASAEVDGVDLGPFGRVRPVCGFGFSEPPARPSIVEVRPRLRGPRGWITAEAAAAT